MGETDYQICLMIVKRLALQGLLTAAEKDAVIAKLKERFHPLVTLLTG